MDSCPRPFEALLAELRDVADWIERSKPQGVLYDSARPALKEALTALSALTSVDNASLATLALRDGRSLHTRASDMISLRLSAAGFVYTPKDPQP